MTRDELVKVLHLYRTDATLDLKLRSVLKHAEYALLYTPVDSKPDVVRVLRILEYVGPRAWVEKTLESGAVPPNGAKRIDSKTIISSAIVRQYPEVLSVNEDWSEDDPRS